MKLALQFFGTFSAVRDGEALTRFEADSARALLVYLTLNPGTLFRREALAALLWPELEESAALHALRQALNRLRTVLRERDAEVPLLDVTRQTLRTNPRAELRLDVRAFSELVAATEAHAHRRRAVCRPCLAKLEEAVTLYQGDLLAGFHLDSLPFEEWLLMQREHLHVQVLQALGELAEAHERRGEYRRAQHYARRQLALEPWREEAHRQLLRTLALEGERSAALAHYESCRQLLLEELGVEPGRETRALYAAIRDEHPLPGGTPPPCRLPTPFTPFIGRTEALRRLTARLTTPEGRLLSLVGPGGTGKTRLAIALAEAVRGDFEHGIFFLPLAAVTSPALIPAALARALAVTPHEKGDLEQQLRAYLLPRELLVIFDNFEQLLPEGAGTLADLLRHAPRLTCVVTSRERLNLPGEWVFPVSGLDYTDTAVPASAHRLFTASAQRVAPDVAFDNEEQRAIGEICRLVEGNPLALELAATWLRAFGCREIAAEIRQSFDFLEAPGPGLPARHRSLRAVFEHSWALLTPAEQGALCRLALFRGGCDREAARQVAGVSPALLVSLLDQSLLQREAERDGAPARYGMHNLVRSYALEQLRACPALEAQTRAAHARYYLDLMAAAPPRLTGPELREALAALERDFANVQAAWEWATAHAEVALLDGALLGLFHFYELRFWIREAEQVFGGAAALAPGTTRAGRVLVQRLRACQGWFAALIEGEVERGYALLGEALDALRRLEAQEQLPFVLNALGRVAYHLSDYEAAQRYSAEGYALSEALGDRYQMALARHILGQAAQTQGRYPESLELLQEGLVLSQTAGFVKLETGLLRALGVSHWRRGEFEEAGAYFEQTLQSCRATGDRYNEGKALTALGTIAFFAEEIDRAATYYKEGLQIAREIGDRRNEGQALNNLSEVYALRKEYARAVRLCEASLHIKREQADQRGAAMTLGNLANMVKYQGDYGAAEAHLQEALGIFRELRDTHGQAMALTVLTALAGECNRPKEALAYGEAALAVAEAQQQRHIHANTLTNLAHVLADLGRWQEARAHYEAALALREELDQQRLAAEPLAGLAEAALAAGDGEAPLAYVERILAAYPLAELRGMDQLFRPPAVCLRVLEATGDPRLPELARALHAELQAHAGKIQKRGLRRYFLQEIAPHRAIVAIYERAGGGS
ncbi:MAG: tetratricopeptide repeat protein [Anaerolineales bacterium]